MLIEGDALRAAQLPHRKKNCIVPSGERKAGILNLTRRRLTIEDDLILACARTDPDVQRIQDLLERDPDCQEVLSKAERWGLVPLVYASLRQVAPSGRVPTAISERLRHLSHRETIYGAARWTVL